METVVLILAILFGGALISGIISGVFKKKKIREQGIIKVQFESGVPGINQGKVNLRIQSDKLTINDVQIIPLSRMRGASVYSEKEVISKGKSVIGRAAAGGIVLGPIGATVGGMSGIGDKKEVKKKHYMSIFFVGKDGTEQQLIVSDDDGPYYLQDFAKMINQRLNITVPHEI